VHAVVATPTEDEFVFVVDNRMYDNASEQNKGNLES